MSTHIDALSRADRRPVRAVAARGGRDRVEPRAGPARRAGRRDRRRDARPGRRAQQRRGARRARRRACAPARADPEKLQRVLFNLIQNAIRHTPADGSVVVRAEPAGDAVEIEVADTGGGIAPADRERVFEPFFRGGDEAARPRGRRRARAGDLARDRRGARRADLARRRPGRDGGAVLAAGDKLSGLLPWRRDGASSSGSCGTARPCRTTPSPTSSVS